MRAESIVVTHHVAAEGEGDANFTVAETVLVFFFLTFYQKY